MPQAVDSFTSVVEQISERLRDLETRVAELESKSVTLSKGTPPESRDSDVLHEPTTQRGSVPQMERPAARRAWLPLIESSAGVFPTLGKAVLGFAGAFLLRAISESGSVPKLAVVTVAIVYSFMWMIWGTRTSDRFAGATYAITSTLILSPMLWEATVRFQALSPSASAVVLVAFVVLTLTFAAGNELQLIPWIATLAAVGTAVALIIATRALVPLAAATLAIAAATEIGVCLGHELTFRLIPAIVADFSIWLLVYILGSDSVPEGYHAAAPATLIVLCAMLPAVYGATIGLRSFIQLHRISIFEIVQGAASFTLGTFGILSASHNAASGILGIVFLLLAVACYWGTLSRFSADAHTRNRGVSATWATVLLVAGNFLLFPTGVQVLFLCVAALLAAIIYTRTTKLSLGLQASFYLAAAAAVSPLAIYVGSALAGTVPSSPHWSAWIVALAAALCYGVESGRSVDEGRRRLLWIIPASIVAFTIAAWCVTAVVRLNAGRVALAASHLSTIRTVIICVLALALGLASRQRHIELRWIAYAALALGTLKLMLEDLRFGNPASLMVSFVFYGLILILLPRLTRAAKPAE